MRLILLAVCLVALCVPPALTAQESAQDLAARLKALEERLQALEAELAALKAAQAAPPPPGAPSPAPTGPAVVQAPAGAPGGPTGQLPVYGQTSGTTKLLNPDISVIGDFIGAVGKNAVRPLPVLEMHESEVGLQAILDPYARGDFFLSFGEEGVDLEEGYITFPALPGGLLAKVGKMRSSFGKVNTLHNHTLPWIDRPLVTENLVGGEEGLTDAGLSLSRLLPAPKDIFLEVTGQIFRGDAAGGVFTATKKGDVSFVGHLRGYGDLTEATNLDLGFSYARGNNELGSDFLTQLFGVDATLRWKPLRRAIYRSFLLRTELVWSRRQQLTATEGAFGLYTSAEYRLNRRWTLGGRYDRSGRSGDASQTDSGFSALITYWPSEFSQIRAQYRFTDFAEGRKGNELLFQFLFSLGAHGAHPF